jgi:hypothetical protein
VGEEGVAKIMSDTPTDGEIGSDVEEYQVHGEVPNGVVQEELSLAHRVVNQFPDFARKHRNFVGGTVAILAGSALIVAAIAIKRRRDQGIETPGEIQRSITPEFLAKAARAVIYPVARRWPRRGKAKEESEN